MKYLNGVGAMVRHRASGFLVVTAILLRLTPELGATELFGRVVECSGYSAAGYVVQGFEVVRTGFFAGRNCSVSDPEARNVGTATTDDDGRYSIVYTATEQDPFHCFFERMAFVQVFLPDGTTLIYTSPQKPGGGIGFFDSAFEDFLIRNSLVGCPQPLFSFSLDGPSEVSGLPGTKVSFEATVLLDTEFAGRPGFHGAEGWIVNVAAEGGTLVSATTAGTLAAKVTDDPPGLVCGGGNGSAVVGLQTATVGPECANLRVVQSLAVLCMLGPVALPLEGVSPSILRVTLEAVMPAQGEQGVCRLYFPENCRVVTATPRNNEGLFEGISVDPVETRELVVTLRGDNVGPSTLFRRADANGSAEVDISDPVSTLGWLFSGTAEPSCLAAADSNDSGDVDLSDAIYTLTWLFSAGERPPSPGPFECGNDATPDGLPACSGTEC